jgi:hypothetical protein
MRRLIYQVACSADGFIAHRDGSLDGYRSSLARLGKHAYISPSASDTRVASFGYVTMFPRARERRRRPIPWQTRR